MRSGPVGGSQFGSLSLAPRVGRQRVWNATAGLAGELRGVGGAANVVRGAVLFGAGDRSCEDRRSSLMCACGFACDHGSCVLWLVFDLPGQWRICHRPGVVIL